MSVEMLEFKIKWKKRFYIANAVHFKLNENTIFNFNDKSNTLKKKLTIKFLKMYR